MAENKIVIVLPEDVKHHARDNLASFIGKVKNFNSEEDRKKAEDIYVEMLKKERKLKVTIGNEFKLPSKTPDKDFNLNRFQSNVKENSLTTAIKAQFVKNPTAAAAGWDYFTLKQSTEKLASLTDNSNSSKPPGQGKRSNERFGETSKELNESIGKQGDPKHVSKVEVSKNPSTGQSVKGATGQPNAGQQSPGRTPQAKAEDVDMAEEHILNAHAHGHFAGMPPLDEEEKEEDDKSCILRLLWAHQDYFDQKALSRAQAEYNFYRVLNRQWKHTMNRVKMDDIRYDKFDLKMFYNLPKNRPLYAVIITILEQSKDKKMAEMAAEEYYRLSVLEQTMFEKQMIKELPEGIELDQGHFSDLFQDMKTRFQTSGRQAQIRQPTEFKMIPLFEYFKLKETITNQRNQIEELASRLSGIASQQLADVGAGFTDLGDKNRPQKLGEKFAELFDETWSSAYESLKPTKPEGKGEEDENDEKTVDTLQRIVGVIYEYCQSISGEQFQRLVRGMIPPIVDPTNAELSGNKAATILPPSDIVRNKTEQMAREYRKVVAPATITVLQKEILEKHIKGKLLAEPISKELDSYINQCVDLIWYMCIQQPPMEIVWAKPGEKFNREQFRFSGKKGKNFKLTVWPAVFLHKGGPLVAQGYAVPE